MLPQTDHVLRYLRPSAFIDDNNFGKGFMPRENTPEAQMIAMLLTYCVILISICFDFKPKPSLRAKRGNPELKCSTGSGLPRKPMVFSQ